MNYARSTKPQIVSRCKELEATVEARGAALAGKQYELDTANRQIEDLQVALRGLQDRIVGNEKMIKIINSRRDLLIEARRLSMQGVPCDVRGDYVFHRETRAVLAQVSQS